MSTGGRVRMRAALIIGGASMMLVVGCGPKRPCPQEVAKSQTHFATPRELVTALVQACRTGNTQALIDAVGVANTSLVQSGDPSADRERCQRFVTAADTMTRLDPDGPDRLVLVVGSDDYPMPVPLVKDAQGWRLDTAAGADEILRRSVGANELRSISICRAAARGATPPASAAGYAYRALPGPGATLAAAPLEYRHSGVTTFVVGTNGTLYEKDLGPDTTELAAAIGGAAPDASWKVVTD